MATYAYDPNAQAQYAAPAAAPAAAYGAAPAGEPFIQLSAAAMKWDGHIDWRFEAPSWPCMAYSHESAENDVRRKTHHTLLQRKRTLFPINR